LLNRDLVDIVSIGAVEKRIGDLTEHRGAPILRNFRQRRVD